MTDLTERSRLVLHRLAEHVLDDLGCAVVTPSKESWVLFDLPAPYRYGWAPPAQIEEDEPALLLVSFCPALIAETTLWLDDDALDTYLTTIEAFVDAMVAAHPRSPLEVYNEIQDVLVPGVLDLVSQVEVRALDDKIVPAGR